jgi:hypothetical protein
MTRSEALEVMARGIATFAAGSPQARIGPHDYAQAALQALEGVMGPLFHADGIPTSEQKQEDSSSQDHAPSTEKARAVDGLADPQGTGEGR